MGWKFLNLKVLTVVLAVCLAVSLLFNGYFYIMLSNNGNDANYKPAFFSFAFGSSMQKLVNGTLWLNLTFNVVDGNLTVKAEVNTESYNSKAFLALQFDSDNNGTIDIHYNPEYGTYTYLFYRDDLQFLLGTDNKTIPSDFLYWGWLPNGTVYISKILPSPSYPWHPESPFHYCTYNNKVYTFHFSFPIKPTPLSSGLCPWLDGEYGIQGKLVRVAFGIEPPGSKAYLEKGMSVYVPPFKFTE